MGVQSQNTKVKSSLIPNLSPIVHIASKIVVPREKGSAHVGKWDSKVFSVIGNMNVWQKALSFSLIQRKCVNTIIS